MSHKKIDGISCNAKLTAKQIADIKRVLADGNLQNKQIAEIFGVAAATVSRIKVGSIYKTVKPSEHVDLNGYKPPVSLSSRRAAVLAFLLEDAPEGTWFYPNYKLGYAQTKIDKSGFGVSLRDLANLGYIETRKPQYMRFGKEVRVICKLVNGQKVEIGLPSPEAETPHPMRRGIRKLIPYAGKDSREQVIW